MGRFSRERRALEDTVAKATRRIIEDETNPRPCERARRSRDSLPTLAKELQLDYEYLSRVLVSGEERRAVCLPPRLRAPRRRRRASSHRRPSPRIRTRTIRRRPVFLVVVHAQHRRRAEIDGRSRRGARVSPSALPPFPSRRRFSVPVPWRDSRRTPRHRGGPDPAAQSQPTASPRKIHANTTVKITCTPLYVVGRIPSTFEMAQLLIPCAKHEDDAGVEHPGDGARRKRSPTNVPRQALRANARDHHLRHRGGDEQILHRSGGADEEERRRQGRASCACARL